MMERRALNAVRKVPALASFYGQQGRAGATKAYISLMPFVGPRLARTAPPSVAGHVQPTVTELLPLHMLMRTADSP